MTTLELHGVAYELAFWKEFVKTDRFITGWVGKEKTPELNNKVAEFILANKNDNILDVGSGAVSLLNGLTNESNLIAKNEITWKCFIPYVKELQLIQHDIDLTLDFRRHQNESPNIEWECPPFKHYYDEWMLSPKFIQKEGKKMIPIL